MATSAQREMKRRGVAFGPCKQRRRASGTTKPLPVPRPSKGPKVSAKERQKRAEQSASAKAVARARKAVRKRARLARSRMLAGAWHGGGVLVVPRPEHATVPPWVEFQAGSPA